MEQCIEVAARIEEVVPSTLEPLVGSLELGSMASSQSWSCMALGSGTPVEAESRLVVGECRLEVGARRSAVVAESRLEEGECRLEVGVRSSLVGAESRLEVVDRSSWMELGTTWEAAKGTIWEGVACMTVAAAMGTTLMVAKVAKPEALGKSLAC